jgi:azurin/sugar lactone lactonase YvrE
VGFEFWNGGVIVSSQPELIFLKDTDGDDIADVRIVLLQGLGSADTHCAANNLLMGPDGAIYFTTGIFLAHNIETPWDSSLNTDGMGVFRFDPRRFTISYQAFIRPNAHGVSFDYWGYQYATDGTSGNAFQIVPTADGFEAVKLLEKEVRPVPASEIISSTHFPESMQGNFMICNSIGFLGIKEYALERNAQTGAVWGEPMGDLLVSTDKNFRPTDAIFGDDGSLYVSDWHNVIIGHMQHNLRDPNRDHKHGRIYRITTKDRPLQKPVEIHGAPIAKLLENLKHPADSVRHRSRVELSTRDSTQVIAATQEWIKQFDPNAKSDAHHLLEALWVHQQHNVKNPELLELLLKSPEPHARIAAQTVRHHWFNLDATSNPAPVKTASHKSNTPKLPAVDNSDPRMTVVRINTLPEKMKYDIAEFEVKAGHRLKIIFSNPDFMPHNLLIVEPGSSEEIGLAALAMGAKGFEMHFRPVSDKVLAGSKMLDHSETETITMTAPTTPGDYEFVCTFPGHYLLMRGVMKVVE